ncbi:MAG: DedA family protein [Gemmatimonadaceae bacterium]
MDIRSIIDTLSGLPLPVLYLAIAVISAIENVFPPFPADAVVAFGSFLAARGTGNPYSSFLCAWLGNFAGATLTYYIGRRYGSGPFLIRLERWVGKNAEARFMEMYGRFGLPALFVSRFLPAVRSLVPPLAGAMKLPPIPVAIAVAAASGIWFAFLTWVAFRAGSDWDALYAYIVRSTKMVGGGAVIVLVILVLGVWIWRRRRNKAHEQERALEP